MNMQIVYFSLAFFVFWFSNFIGIFLQVKLMNISPWLLDCHFTY